MAKKEDAGSKKWFDGLKAEFRKIIWPNREDIQKETTAVVVVSVILGVIIAVLDFIVQHGVDFLVNL
ncbi:MAG: preprotein translocase subunit SecE [Lachnospiraceae bacterium]|nr:preprotein translocase subunit SecE [Lachnospiraceae bacterium]